MSNGVKKEKGSSLSSPEVKVGNGSYHHALFMLDGMDQHEKVIAAGYTTREGIIIDTGVAIRHAQFDGNPVADLVERFYQLLPRAMSS